MAKKRMTFREWYAQLGESVPLDMAPKILGRSEEEIRHAVMTGTLPVHRFEAADGRVFRLVRVSDLFAFGRNPLTLRGMARALALMAEQPKITPEEDQKKAA